MTTEDALQALLDANPDDHTTRLVLADWLQDYGDPRADGYRALGALRMQPEDFGGKCPWTWWLVSSFPETRNPIGMLARCWFDAIPKVHPAGDSSRDYDTRREAEDAAAIAFSKLPPERRAELLNPELVPA